MTKINKTQKAHWYLLYTKPRAEKKVAVELALKGYECYLPLQRSLKQWSDRKKWVEEPLFKSYLFINTELEKNFYAILNTPGVVKFVNFERQPAVVDVRELELVKRLMGEVDIHFSSIELDSMQLGDEVEIIAGPLIGHRGRLGKIQGPNKVILTLSSIQQGLAVTLPSEFIRGL
jgi:transcription antitermination factor NusG